MSDNTEIQVFDVLARAFIQEDVETCFALLGDANMNWATRLREQGCRMIYVRHEHCAVAAAMAYARKSGDVWCCLGDLWSRRYAADDCTACSCSRAFASRGFCRGSGRLKAVGTIRE